MVEISMKAIITKLTMIYYLFILINRIDYVMAAGRKHPCGKPTAPKNGYVTQETRSLYKYSCKSGFELIASSEYRKCTNDKKTWKPRKTPKCQDINECRRSPCDRNADCINSKGSFECICRRGFVGNGYNCEQSYNTFANYLQEDDTCGIVSKHYNTKRIRRIIGGVHSKPGQWPWMALITVHRGPSTILGGVLVRPGWVLTVASLLHKKHGLVKEDDIIVTLGEHDINRPSIDEQQFRVKRIHINPKFNKTNLKNDIALLELESDAEMNDYVNTICLTTKRKARKFERGRHLATIAGWGLTEPQKLEDLYSSKPKLYSGILRDVTLTIFGPNKCKRNTNYDFFKKKMLCAGSLQELSAPCLGDVGSPLVIQDPETKRWLILGLYSWSEGCGQQSKFSYYTRVAPFRNWIEDVTRFKNNHI